MADVTVSIVASGDDAYVSSGGAVSYPPGAGSFGDDSDTSIRTEKSFYVPPDSVYWVNNTLLRFATGDQIPDDATITNAILRLRGTSKNDSADARSITWEYYAFDGSWAVGDWTATAATTAHAGATIASLSTSADVDFTLLNPNTNITKVASSYTGLRSHVSGGSPANVNYWDYATYDNTTLTEPRLIVTYTPAGGGTGASTMTLLGVG